MGGITEEFDILTLTATTLVITLDAKKERWTFVRR